MTSAVSEKSAKLGFELEEKIEKTSGRIFDCVRDKKLIADSTHFLCSACLVARPVEDRSYDQRYCQRCYDFLLKEVELGGHQKATWRPKTPQDEATSAVPKLPTWNTMLGRNNEVMAHTNKGNGGHCSGRPSLGLPVERIKSLAEQKVKVAEIIQQLHGENIKVSRRTVYRVLSKKSSQH